jgi:hypothetical protein
MLAASAIEITPMSSSYFMSYGVVLGRMDDGKINISFTVVGQERSDVIGVSSYKVQKKVNGSWTDATSSQPGSLAYDSYNHAFVRYYSGTPGVEYRVYCVFVCVNSVGTGTQGFYSGSVIARN